MQFCFNMFCYVVAQIVFPVLGGGCEGMGTRDLVMAKVKTEPC